MAVVLLNKDSFQLLGDDSHNRGTLLLALAMAVRSEGFGWVALPSTVISDTRCNGMYPSPDQLDHLDVLGSVQAIPAAEGRVLALSFRFFAKGNVLGKMHLLS